jgi:hypothetical protein
MKTRAHHNWRPSAVNGVDDLEDRMLLSAIGHSILAPAAHVGALLHSRTISAADLSHSTARSVGQAVSRPDAQKAGFAVRPTSNRWSWLANTYWCVPPQNLPAVVYDSMTGTVTPVRDQTVFHITSYENGYFWGTAVTQINSSTPSTSSMLGSVTPEGRVLLTFTTTSQNSSPFITEGFGTMQRKYGQWTMENQMFTSPSETLQIGHWAYMVQTRPGMPSWNSLPGAGVSVPTFLTE